MKKKKNKKTSIITKIKNIKLNDKQRLTIGIWIIIIGLLIVSGNYLMERKNAVYDEMTFQLSATEIPEDIITTPDEEVPDDALNDTNESTTGDDTYIPQPYYIGRIEIPKINLVKGFADLGSAQNNVNRNVTIIETSTYPDVEKGNFILAAHTGNAWNCFFRNLYKLELGDEAYIYYNGMKYTYKAVSIYNQEKNGTVRILRNWNETTLTLITCTKNSYTKQTVFILNLVSKEAV